MATENILSVSLKEYKKDLDDLRATLATLKKGSEEYEETVKEIEDRQERLNEALQVGKKNSQALEGSYNALSKEMSALKKEWKATNDEARRNELGKQIDALNGQLKELDSSIGVHNRNVGNYAIAGRSMKAELKSIQAEMAGMLANGVSPTSEAFQTLAKRAGDIKDAMNDAGSVVNQFSDDFKGMNTAISVVKTGAAAFGTFTSAMAVFGVENEKVAQSMQKLMAIQTLLTSLNELQKAFDKSTASGQFFGKIIDTLTLSKSVNAKITEEQATAEVANTVATGANTASKTANTASETANTASETANTSAVIANTTAQEANAVATGGATVATNLFKKALISTGIGAIVVLLGTLIASWDKITQAVKNAVGWTDNYTGASKKAEEQITKENKAIDDEVRLMKAQGVSEAKIIEYKQKKVKAQIAEIQGKIADIEATKKQMQTSNTWYKVISKGAEIAMKNVSIVGRAVLWVFDKIFQTDFSDAFDKMVSGWATSLADWVTGVDGMNDEIQGLTDQLDKLKDQSHTLDIDAQCNKYSEAANRATKATKALGDAQKKAHDDYVKGIKEEIDALGREHTENTKLKDLLQQIKKVKGLINEEDEKVYAVDKLRDEETYLKGMLGKYKTYARDEKLTVDERKEYAKLAQETEARLNETKLQKMLAQEEAYTTKIKNEYLNRLNVLDKNTREELERINFAFDQMEVGIEPIIDWSTLKNGFTKQALDSVKGLEEIGNEFAKKLDLNNSFDNLTDGIKERLRLLDKETLDTLYKMGIGWAKPLDEVQKALVDNWDKMGIEIQGKLNSIGIFPDIDFKDYADKLSKYYQSLNELDEDYESKRLEGEISMNTVLHNKMQVHYADMIKAHIDYIKKSINDKELSNRIREQLNNAETDKEREMYQAMLREAEIFDREYLRISENQLHAQEEYEKAKEKLENATTEKDKEILSKRTNYWATQAQMMEEQLDNLIRSNQNYADAMSEIDSLMEERARENADFMIKQQERINKKRQEDIKNSKEHSQKVRESYLKMAEGIGNVMGSVADIMQNNLEQKVKNGEISEEQAQEEFERIKKLQVAQTVINTLAGAVGGFLQAVQTYPAPYGPILGGITSAAALAAGVAQVQQIEAQEYGSSGSSSMGGGTGGGGSMASVQPLLNEDVDAQQLTAINTEQIANTQQETKVYVVESDISNKQNQAKTRVAQTTF